MKIVCTLENVNKSEDSIFLAGPTHRDNTKLSWRKEAVELFQEAGFDGTLFIPEHRGEQPEEWTYSRQIDWEIKALKAANVIMFWIPRVISVLPGFTTNIEVGEWLHSNKIVIGSPENAEKNEYLKERCSRLGLIWHDALWGCVKASLGKISLKPENIWFTADTHFGEQRTLELSKRPFCSVKDMDNSIIHQWNGIVGDNDIVYHLGDFGSSEVIKELRGEEIRLILGNYDTDEIVEELLKDKRVKVLNSGCQIEFANCSNNLRLVHKPIDAANYETFYLFGHIHKLQMVKKNGFNVGVDCHNFEPISLETVMFYKNGILNHYDENVWTK